MMPKTQRVPSVQNLSLPSMVPSGATDPSVFVSSPGANQTFALILADAHPESSDFPASSTLVICALPPQDAQTCESDLELWLLQHANGTNASSDVSALRSALTSS